MAPRLEGGWLTVGITFTCGMAFMLFGYDQGVFGGLLSNKLFLRTFGNPDATIQGQIVSTYDIGCIIGALSSIFVADKLGRRRSIQLGCCFVVVGGLLQATAFGLPQMIIGRIVAGCGTGFNTTAVPIYQSETSKPTERGKLIVLQLVLVLFGIVITNWMNFGFTWVPNNDVSWRFPLAFQDFFAIVTIFLLYIMPESPRWLCLKDRHEEARVVISKLLAKPVDDSEVNESLELMIDSISRERSMAKVGLREIFSNGRHQTFRRIALGAGTSFMQQIGGTNVIVYYLPVLLVDSFGFSQRLALILSAVDSISLMIWGSVASLLIDRVGRRKLMLFGAFGNAIFFAIAAAGLSQDTRGWNAVAVTAIFLYYVTYGLSFLSIPFMYPSEINSQRMRNTGSAIAMITNWLFVYVVVLITPTGVQNIGWKFYIIFAVINFSFLPLIWYYYIETANMSLEEIDRMFEIKYDAGKEMTYKQAAKRAREEVECYFEHHTDRLEPVNARA
ncbi:general substrate transporter [Rhizodiscina lignyota]|uniref:General substrate transporter n=1 Tax=Rhizodiscina lignyota TaxID=1504668 RepID=A0A9P4M3U8_9PEZI|nr:general substrate transporter [Rhizodiscina lignyota]